MAVEWLCTLANGQIGVVVIVSHSTFATVCLQSTKLYSDVDANQNVFGGKSLEFGGNESDDSFKTVRLRDRLNEADTERRKDEDAAAQRERAAEIAREERMAKIAYMENMAEDTPAGTGKLIKMLSMLRVCVVTPDE